MAFSRTSPIVLDGTRLFDEATLAPKLEKYLPGPLEIRCRVHERGGHKIPLIFFGRHANGYAVFHTTGAYQKGKKTEVVFRAGDIFWRNGTRSERISQAGMEAIIERRIVEAKTEWVQEQQDLRQRDREELAQEYQAQRRVVDEPLGSINFDLDTDELINAVLELIHRGNEKVPLIRLMNDALARAREAIERDEIETELANLLDKLTCLAATFLEYEQNEWFDRVIAALVQIYGMPLSGDDARRFAYSTSIDPNEKAPRVWLLIIERIYGLGALAVRRGKWDLVRTLTLQLPDALRADDDDGNWLRHGLTMSSRAHRLQEQQDGRTTELSLLSLARNEVERLACLRPDGLAGDDGAIITSLARFDVLSNLAAIDGAGDADDRVFYTNFARFRQARIQPILDQLLTDPQMRAAIFRGDDDHLAAALAAIARMARHEGFRYDGFEGFGRTPVGDFLTKHAPAEEV